MAKGTAEGAVWGGGGGRAEQQLEDGLCATRKNACLVLLSRPRKEIRAREAQAVNPSPGH